MSDSGLRSIFLIERPVLLRLLTSRLGHADEAEDVLQDMWVKLETPVAGPIANPAPYLFRMAMNLALDRRRSAKHRAAREDAWMSAQPAAEEFPTSEDALVAREQLQRVEAAIAALPERTALVFRQFRFEGKAQKTIAAELGVSLSTVEKSLQQAYRKIHDAKRKSITVTSLPPRPAGRGKPGS